MFTAERENEPPLPPHRPTARQAAATITAVGATYAYFLIFAQFGYLHALTATLGDSWLRPVMIAMGLSGIAGSLGAVPFQRVGMTVGFFMAGLAAALTLWATTPVMFMIVAALTGGGTGLITVGLAARVVRETGIAQLGLCLGAGTGLAYALCNLPAVFTATVQTQAVLGIAAAGTGWVALQFFAQRGPAPANLDLRHHVRGVAAWTVVLLTLVATDSAVFYHIQQTPELKSGAWTGSSQLLLNALAHLIAGGLAGLLLDRGWLGGMALMAAAVLAIGAHQVFQGEGWIGAPLYAAAVSVYSTVLIYYPARRGRAGLAAWIYAVAGWVGSAAGIGLAERSGGIPGWGLWLVPGVVAACLVAKPKDVQ